jgi:hypothetical protein
MYYICVHSMKLNIFYTDNECFETTAMKYNGQVSVTKSGKKCLFWSDVSDAYYNDYYVPNFPEIPVEGASDFCRSPGGW